MVSSKFQDVLVHNITKQLDDGFFCQRWFFCFWQILKAIVEAMIKLRVDVDAKFHPKLCTVSSKFQDVLVHNITKQLDDGFFCQRWFFCFWQILKVIVEVMIKPRMDVDAIFHPKLSIASSKFQDVWVHNITKQLDDGFFSQEGGCDWKTLNLQLYVENFTVLSLGVEMGNKSCHQYQGILELKEKYVCPILGPHAKQQWSGVMLGDPIN